MPYLCNGKKITLLPKFNHTRSAMYQKFIINREGVLKFGHVYLHRDILAPGEQCPYGGGLWKIDEGRGAVILYGRSFDFGPPDFDYVKRIDWSALGGTPRPLLYLPHWPSEEEVIAITCPYPPAP